MTLKILKNKKEYLELIEEVKKHDELYYQQCAPEISDYEYDLLIKALEEYEKACPEDKVENSPTGRIGEAATKGFEESAHHIPMLSLANTYSEEEIGDFMTRVEKILHRKDILYSCELKIDGTAISCRYEDGQFVQAVTRGDGRKGDVVTNNVKTIHMLPLQLKNAPPFLEIRGEVFMNKTTFYEINKQRQEEGFEEWANPRNAAAGTLKLHDPKEVAERHLNILFYGIAEGAEVISQFEVHHFLKKLLLPIADEKYFALCRNLQEIMDFAKKVHNTRKNLPFEIDGIVIKVDDRTTYETLGTTGKTPRSAVAYKFAPEQAKTEIEEITIQVGRTGVLTPVAELKPVFLAGSTISRATLHNEDEVTRKDIRVGDVVIIEKGGDVIPKVVSVDTSFRKKESFPWHMPKHCPICTKEVIKNEGEVAWRCPNSKCAGKKLRRLVYFASKMAFDIEHMGEKVVEQLVNKGLITKPSDIFTLTEEALYHLEGFKEKSVKNLLESIEKAKDCTLAKFIMGLEIKYVGKETAELLADNAGSLEKLSHMSEEELLSIHGIGEKSAKAIFSYFQDPENQEEIHLLLKHGVHPKTQEKKRTDHLFSHKTFVLTGALKNYSREKASELIKARGGKISSSVSKETDYLLLGEDPGSKYEKAKKLNISILDEAEFERLL